MRTELPLGGVPNLVARKLDYYPNSHARAEFSSCLVRGPPGPSWFSYSAHQEEYVKVSSSLVNPTLDARRHVREIERQTAWCLDRTW